MQETGYEVTIKTDGTPPTSPTSPRCEPKSPSTIGVQWNKSPQRDVVGYHVQYRGTSPRQRRCTRKEHHLL